MEFKFPITTIFHDDIVEIDHTLIPPGFKGDRRALWDTIGKVSEILNAMGEASAAAQGLTTPITTSDRLRNSEHTVYLLIDQQAGDGRGAVTGMLKTGKKSLYIFDRNGQHYQVSPTCVLDFYVHESCQRMGLGKQLYEHMLQKENTEPIQMAIDRPSEKFLGFLNKHYNLKDPVKQMNNYVVFDDFFPKTQETNGTVQIIPESGGKKVSANGLQAYTSPMGRYGAPRPPCSMGQIIHNQTSTIQKSPETQGSVSMPEMRKTTPENSGYSDPVITQSVPNMSSNKNCEEVPPCTGYNLQPQQQQQQQPQQQQQQQQINYIPNNFQPYNYYANMPNYVNSFPQPLNFLPAQPYLQQPQQQIYNPNLDYLRQMPPVLPQQPMTINETQYRQQKSQSVPQLVNYEACQKPNYTSIPNLHQSQSIPTRFPHTNLNQPQIPLDENYQKCCGDCTVKPQNQPTQNNENEVVVSQNIVQQKASEQNVNESKEVGKVDNIQDESNQAVDKIENDPNSNNTGDTKQLVEDQINLSPKLERPRSLSIQQNEEIDVNNEKNDDIEEDEVHDVADDAMTKDDIINKLSIESNDDDDDKSSNRRTPSHLTEKGYFDLKFYHNKLW